MTTFDLAAYEREDRQFASRMIQHAKDRLADPDMATEERQAFWAQSLAYWEAVRRGEHPKPLTLERAA